MTSSRTEVAAAGADVMIYAYVINRGPTGRVPAPMSNVYNHADRSEVFPTVVKRPDSECTRTRAHADASTVQRSRRRSHQLPRAYAYVRTHASWSGTSETGARGDDRWLIEPRRCLRSARLSTRGQTRVSPGNRHRQNGRGSGIADRISIGPDRKTDGPVHACSFASCTRCPLHENATSGTSRYAVTTVLLSRCLRGHTYRLLARNKRARRLRSCTLRFFDWVARWVRFKYFGAIAST